LAQAQGTEGVAQAQLVGWQGQAQALLLLL
jgi:hypothetical protein